MSAVIRAAHRFGKGSKRRHLKRKLADLVQADFAKSGIDEATRKRLGIRRALVDTMWNALHPSRKGQRPRDATARGWIVPFFNPDGTLMNFARGRKVDGDWNANDDGSQRYNQPANTRPHAYMPIAIMGLPDPDPVTGKIKIKGELLIVEGEKKAIKANLCNILAVALAGVWNFGSAKFDLPIVEELRAFDLSEADIVVCFDTDIFENEHVEAALKRIMYVLRTELRPRSLKRVQLTGETTGGKIALDDWLASFDSPRRAQNEWNALERKEDRAAECFAIYDDEVVYCLTEKKYYDVANRTYFPSQKNLFEQYSIGTKIIGTDGKKLQFPIQVWNDTRGPKSIVREVQYRPGRPVRFLQEPGDKHETLNLWRPSPIVPVVSFDPKDPGLLELIAYFDHLTATLEDTQRKRFMQWLAYPLQRVGKKVMWAAIAVSEATGVGKGFLFNSILQPIYDHRNAVQVEGSTLNSRYNNFVMSQLVMVDEVHVPTYGEQSAVMAKLKTMITEPTHSYEDKYIKRRSIPNCTNLYLTSNFVNDALRLDADDRRFMVIDVRRNKEWNPARFKRLADWLSDGGLEIAYRYLLDIDTSDFNPHDVAPMTAAKQRMMARKDGAAGELVRMLIESPNDVLGYQGKRPPCDLFEPQFLGQRLSKYAAEHQIRYRGEINGHTVGAFLRGRKIPKQRFMAKRCGADTETNVTLYAIYNAKQWRDREKEKWKSHWLRSNQPTK